MHSGLNNNEVPETYYQVMTHLIENWNSIVKKISKNEVVSQLKEYIETQFINRATVNEPIGIGGESVLYLALLTGDIDIIKQLLDMGGRLSHIAEGTGEVTLSVIGSNLELLKEVLEYQPDDQSFAEDKQKAVDCALPFIIDKALTDYDYVDLDFDIDLDACSSVNFLCAKYLLESKIPTLLLTKENMFTRSCFPDVSIPILLLVIISDQNKEKFTPAQKKIVSLLIEKCFDKITNGFERDHAKKTLELALENPNEFYAERFEVSREEIGSTLYIPSEKKGYIKEEVNKQVKEFKSRQTLALLSVSLTKGPSIFHNKDTGDLRRGFSNVASHIVKFL